MSRCRCQGLGGAAAAPLALMIACWTCAPVPCAAVPAGPPWLPIALSPSAKLSSSASISKAASSRRRSSSPLAPAARLGRRCVPHRAAVPERWRDRSLPRADRPAHGRGQPGRRTRLGFRWRLEDGAARRYPCEPHARGSASIKYSAQHRSYFYLSSVHQCNDRAIIDCPQDQKAGRGDVRRR
jgi:hypothetical protein